MRPAYMLASIAVLSAALAVAFAASLLIPSGGEAQWWPAVVLLGALCLGLGFAVLTTEKHALLPSTSAELSAQFTQRFTGGREPYQAHKLAATRAMCHALYGEHARAERALYALHWDNSPALEIIRHQALATLSYLRTDRAARGLEHARAALELTRRTRTSRHEQRTAQFFVAWGEVLTCAVTRPELALFERLRSDKSPLLRVLATAALARAFELLGDEVRALRTRDQLADIAPRALGAIAHAGVTGGAASGVRSRANSGAMKAAS